ncbi:MAG: 50S ribosomal protein L17 [Finegoldia magna]|uniref:50S ribosomal protein L17 n=1 Tax=Finegoldia magna TaxID=1260 RepID=UPI0029146AF4|nr:50S ribosomal protein L17 [Finegoldia magna]MDU7330459.1 50S ribosomal protein L17 [Finegoldia magna]
MANLRKLGRRTDHRTAMLRNLVQSLFENGKIETTVTRAKEVRREAEKMITLGKKGDLSSRREALKYIYKKDVVNTLFEEIAPVYADRQGGYTRILKLRPRRGDGSEMCILELVDYTKKESSNEKETVKADK